MKKKIITSVIITVVFALVIITSSFMALYSIQEIENSKSMLKEYNSIISELDIENASKLGLFKINGKTIELTIIDKDGNIKFNSSGNEGNISYASIIKEAENKGVGYLDKYNENKKINMIYCGTKLSNGDTIISGVEEPTTNIFQVKNTKYYIITLIIVLLLSIALALKLVRIIVDPIKHLESVTWKIAHGNLQTRVNVVSNDELGQLGKTFNNMADQLQSKINEVVDKQNRLESILKSMQSGVIAVDNEDRIITINPYAQKIFGINVDVTGKYLNDCIEDKRIKEILNNETVDETQVKIKKPFRRFLKIKKAIVINGYKKIGRVIAIQDITEMKRLENIRSQFVANVSHELKTPLTSIKGFAETLRYVEDEETKIKFLDIIDKETERLTRLISDILVLSDLENNPVEELEEIFPDGIITDAINILSEHARKKNIYINFESDNNDFILGQKDKFLQIVINIIENSIKYSNNNTKINVKSFSDKEYYYFKVKDNGIGIPKEDLPRIFERFYRVDKARKSGGTGLGLAIVKHIVKTFGGEISVDSEVLKGTEFTFKIKHI
ncbi:HAMP domain-containing sensor histidine kinase [Clostridium sp.]|uniref:HAMP domain-containing sensor histidine kinase n=1 Tax=Clostridium sp. TaxID=1506 RepID=UPI0026DCFBD9|nr:HAMP domain-containing sensor histidine kinase [Clostridium sp.]MDO5038136.1 ATP-binding protein [Clostridium sp.]